MNINQRSERILNLMPQDWQLKLPSKPKLRTFAFYKEQIECEDLECEEYVKTYSKGENRNFTT